MTDEPKDDETDFLAEDGSDLGLADDGIRLDEPAPVGGEPEPIRLEGEDLALGTHAEPDITIEPEPAPAAPTAAAAAAAPEARPSAPATPAIIFDTPGGATPAPAAKARPEYTTEPPSIAAPSRREPLEVPAASPVRRATSARTPVRRRGTISVPRWAVLAAAAAVVALGAYAAYRTLAGPAPVLLTVSPPKVEPGGTISASGTSLGGVDVVRIGDREAAVVSRSESQVVATVPEGLPAFADVAVSMQAGGRASNALFVRVVRYPRVQSIVPDVALPGQEIALRGQGLGHPAATVHVGGLAADVIGRSDGELRIRVPALTVAEGSAVNVEVAVEGESPRVDPLLVGRLPLLASAQPASGPPGTRVTLAGRGFAADTAANVVTFGGERVLVLSGSPTELVVVAPAAPDFAPATPLAVSVSIGQGRSSEVVFTAVGTTADVYLPRFFPLPGPAPVAESAVQVATEMGPVLILAGRGDAPSLAARATRAADALTRAMETGSAPAFAVRDATLLAGETPLLTALPEDCEAYGRVAGRGPRLAPRELASFWAALLGDYFDLFVAGTRPVRAAAFTDRARALLEIHAETERAGPGGVRSRVVRNLTGPQRDALRALAFHSPGAAPPSGVVIAGRWDGSMDDGGLTRPILVEFTTGGGRLAGTLTTRAGDLAMRVPLREVRLSRGTVVFAVVLHGTPREFRGTLEGVTLQGTVHLQGRPDAAGRFTLRHLG